MAFKRPPRAPSRPAWMSSHVVDPAWLGLSASGEAEPQKGIHATLETIRDGILKHLDDGKDATKDWAIGKSLTQESLRCFEETLNNLAHEVADLCEEAASDGKAPDIAIIKTRISDEVSEIIRALTDRAYALFDTEAERAKIYVAAHGELYDELFDEMTAEDVAHAVCSLDGTDRTFLAHHLSVPSTTFDHVR